MTLRSTSSTKTAPADWAAARRKRLRKAAKRAGYLGVGLLGILLVVFFLLPVWISNEQGRTYVLQQLNRNMRAKVAIEDWSLGWFRGTELKNVTVTLPDGTRLVSCPRVQSELTLWGILWGRYDVGITRIETAQLSITRYADASTSLDALFTERAAAGNARGESMPANIFRTLRGSLQVGSAVVTINSVATGKSLTYTEVQAGVTIASPEAPFHVQISAVGAAAGDLSLSLNATLPAFATWPAPAWSMVSDLELSATGLPTALVCDYCGEDPRWEDSLGPVMERVRFSNHARPPLETSLPTLEVKGTEGAFVDAAMLLRAAGDVRTGTATATLSLPAASAGAEDFHAAAALRISVPLVEWLRRINPVLGAIQKGDGLVDIRLNELNVTAGNGHNIQATGRLTFPPLELGRRGIVSAILNAGGEAQAQEPASVPAIAEPLRARLAGGVIAYDNFIILCGRRQRLAFSGTVGLDGTVKLLASVPAFAGGIDGGTLGSARTEIPITGTTHKPVVTLPQ